MAAKVFAETKAVNPCDINYKKLQNETERNTDYSIGFEIFAYDTDKDGKVDVWLWYPINQDNQQSDLVYDIHGAEPPLFVGVDIDADLIADYMGIYDSDLRTCRIY